MKPTFLLFALLAAFGDAFAGPYEGEVNLQEVRYQQRIFEGMINDTINKAVDMLAQYDPIEIGHQEVDLLEHHAEVTNCFLRGFSNVAATKIKLGGLITWTLDMTLEAPLVIGHVENWKIVGEAVHGDGDAGGHIEKFAVKVKATINPLTQYIKTMQITPSIGNAKVSLTGIYHDEELSQKISDFISHLLNEEVNNNKGFHDIISKIALKVARRIMG